MTLNMSGMTRNDLIICILDQHRSLAQQDARIAELEKEKAKLRELMEDVVERIDRRAIVHRSSANRKMTGS
ncbi:MAG: hypothetical protein NVSMB22_18560 [Chloroflexota bacterium]